MYRNDKLLKTAKGAPCQYCFIENGTTVAAHSNQYRDGRGSHLKSHDYRIAFLCNTCHNEIDYGRLTKDERTEMWEVAHRNTIGYLFENNLLKVV